MGQSATVRCARRRIQMLAVIGTGLFALLGLRAAWLGTVRASWLSAKADRQHLLEVPMLATRGAILSADGQPMAVDLPTMKIVADARYVREPKTTADLIASVTHVDAARRDEIERLLRSKRAYVIIAKQVKMKEGEYLRQKNLPGIHFERTTRRSYPLGKVGGQLLGFTNLENGDGLEGLEASQHKVLDGTDGRRVEVRDPQLGQTVRIQDAEDPVPGKSVELTINSAIQRKMEEVLVSARLKYKAKGATGIVMDPNTGEIIAMGSVPRLDPNDRAGLKPEETQVRAVTDPYEPGSVFKIVTIAGALDEGLTTPATTYNLPPSITIKGDPKDYVITDAHKRTDYETMSTTEILQHSSNIGTIEISKLLRKENHLRSWMARFGFGEKTGIDFPHESGGVLPKPKWNAGQVVNIPFGQGMSATQLQQIRAYAAIANGGELVTPHVIKAVGGTPRAVPAKRRIMSERTATQLTTMLEKVVEGSDGTGVEASLANYTVAGKTGTAEKVENGVYVNRYRASFIGFVPSQKPKLVIAVMIDDPDPQGDHTGGLVAAPAFKDIADYALSTLAIPPD